MQHQILYSPKEIHSQVKQLANAIDNAKADSYLVLTVLKGAAIFSSDLVRAMQTATELEYITAASYLDDFTPGDSITITHTSRLNLEGRHVLIVEDIIDTRRTLQQIHQTVTAEQPESITTVTLVNKTNRRETAYQPDHHGFTITNEFIYGYGLDWNQQHRDLPYIAIANPPHNPDPNHT